MGKRNDANNDADADDIFDDIDDDTSGDDGDMDDAPPSNEPPEQAAPGDADESELVREAVADIAELGIVIPDSVQSCRDFCEHFVTAVKTHKATKAMGSGDGTGEAVAMSTSDAATEESPMMMNTVREHFDPAVRHLGQVAEVLAENHVKSTRKGYLKRIARLERYSKITADHAGDLRKMAGGIQLSLNRQGDAVARTTLDEILDNLERMPVDGLALSSVRSIPNPLPANEEDVKEMAERLTTRNGKNAAANGNGNGKR